MTVGNRTKMTTTNARPYGSDAPTEGLYHLDEPAGETSAADASGNEHDGTVGSAADFTEAGRYGGSAEFDGGSGSEITIADHADFEFGAGEFSIEAWIWIDSLGALPMAIMSKWNGAAKSWMLMVNADGKLEGRVYSTGTGDASVVSNDMIPTGEWVHVAFERDAQGELALYVDGVKQDDTETFTASLGDTAEAVVIGASGAGDNFTGKIDEARLSSSARGANLGKVVVNYVYNARNQLVTETCGVNVRTYEYDQNGNTTKVTETVGVVDPVTIAVEDMAYDALNRMTSYTGPSGTESSSYRGAEWHRFSHSAKGVSKSLLYDGDNVLADIDSGVDAFYVTPFLDQNLSMTRSSATHYYSQDGLGSVRTLTDSSGTVKNKYDYLPFGRPFAPGTSVVVQQRYTYTGREQNPFSPLIYYRYRQYDPRVGRFVSRDPAVPRNPGIGPYQRAWRMLSTRRLVDPSITEHLYGYVDDCPVSRVDPHGFGWLKDILSIVPIVGTVINIATDPDGANVTDYQDLAVTKAECDELGIDAAEIGCLLRMSAGAAHFQGKYVGLTFAHDVMDVFVGLLTAPTIIGPVVMGVDLVVDTGTTLYKIGKIPEATRQAMNKYCDCCRFE